MGALFVLIACYKDNRSSLNNSNENIVRIDYALKLSDEKINCYWKVGMEKLHFMTAVS